MENVTTTSYCNLTVFGEQYRNVHGYLSLIVCIFGSVANVFNICVLTTKDMRWPTNYILTALAVADLLVMLEYIPFVLHRYINLEKRFYAQHYTFNWAVFLMFHALFTQILHFISCCLTVLLAIWRHIAIAYPQNILHWCSKKRTKLFIFFIYLLCPVMCLPMFLALRVTTMEHNCNLDGRFPKNQTAETQNKCTIYLVSDENTDHRYISFAVYGVFLKLIPCVLLTFFSYKLIKALVQTKKRTRLLLNTSITLDIVDENNRKKQRQIEKEQQTDRTTRMLLAVLLLFLITEFPQAILGLLSVLYGDKFDKECYRPLGKYKLFLFFLICIFPLAYAAISACVYSYFIYLFYYDCYPYISAIILAIISVKKNNLRTFRNL